MSSKLTPEEYRVVVSVGLAAVHHGRKTAKNFLQEYKQFLDEEKAFEQGG